VTIPDIALPPRSSTDQTDAIAGMSLTTEASLNPGLSVTIRRDITYTHPCLE